MAALRPYLILILLLSSSIEIRSQIPPVENPTVARGKIEGADTVALMELPEVRVYQRKDFEYLYLKRKYQRLIRNVKKAYPYAKVAGQKLKELDQALVQIDSERKRKAYIEEAEKAIMEEFEKEVRKLTVTQGIILVKLIDRETGRTSYEVIRELRGNITAFFWQGIARIFGNNLKTEYDPEKDDKVIEDIIRGIEAGFI
ncbi:MAG: DUF4294 domain-containing protein [Bacteroidales bacterium]